MCEKHYYYNTGRSGQLEKQSVMTPCHRATQRGKTCETLQRFKHPENEQPPLPPTTRFVSSHLPPSPPSSDASFPSSGSDGERSHRRRTSTYIYGDRVVDVSPRPSRRERHNSNHVVIVEPSAPHTPPRYVTPAGSPSRSPPVYIHETRSRGYALHEPSEVRVHVGESRHSRRPSTSHARRMSVSQVSDEDMKVRKLERDLKKAKEAARQQKVQSEIARANEKIASRPAAPAPPAPPKYRRGSVSIMQSGDMLVDPMRKMHVHESVYNPEYERRRREKQLAAEEERKRQEEEAQLQRLKARMAPNRSNTVSGHGHHNVYDGRRY